MIASTRPRWWNAAAAAAILLFAGAYKSFGQSPILEDLDLDRADAVGAGMLRATMPVTVGWFNGEPCLYISTEASDSGVAATFGITYAPALASAATPAPIYAVTNFAQGNIVASAPSPAGPGNSSAGYSPLWQINMVNSFGRSRT